MIARLKGRLIQKSPTALIVDVGGVGYEILASLETYQKLPAEGQELTLHIHTHVREDDLILFGFAKLREKKLFQKLIKVNGVGPRLALNILSGISVDELVEAIGREDLVRMTAIPGVGKKTAERMIIDLKDKMIDFHEKGTNLTLEKSIRPFRDDLISVLINLGYKRPQAEKAVQDIPLPQDLSLQEAVRKTLQHLGESRK
jgi:holliday junction DNA helicase RuvA